MSANIIKFVLCLGVAGGASAFIAKDRANTFEAYGLTGPTLTLAQDCDSSMRRYNLEFKQGSSNHAGCACLAREVSANIDTPDYDYLSENFTAILKARHDNDDEAAASVIMSAMLSGDAEKAGNLMSMMGYMTTCSNRTSEQEIRQTYIEKNPQNSVEAGALKQVEASKSAQQGLRGDNSKKPTGKCAGLTDKQLALREKNASEAGLRFDRISCKSYSL